MPRKTKRSRHKRSPSKSRRRLAQEGGAFEIGQKYIQNPHRLLWVETLYPLSGAVIEAFRQIPWRDYTFKGESEQIVWDKATETLNIRAVPIHAISKAVPYRVIGGAACELYNAAVPHGPSLRRYAEPTADMDVHASYPVLASADNTSGSDLTMIYNRDHFTALGDNYTRWLLTQLRNVMRPVADLADRLGPRVIRMSPDMDGETAMSDLYTHVGKLLITRIPMPKQNMIKIQVGTCVTDGEERQVCFHMLELIFTIDAADPLSTENSSWLNVGKVLKINGLIVASILDVLWSQFEALKSRSIDEVDVVYNHYARIRYLIQLIVYLYKKGKRDQLWKEGQPIPPQIALLFEESHVFDDPRSCPPPAVCNGEALLAPLTEIIPASIINDWMSRKAE